MSTKSSVYKKIIRARNKIGRKSSEKIMNAVGNRREEYEAKVVLTFAHTNRNTQ